MDTTQHCSNLAYLIEYLREERGMQAATGLDQLDATELFAQFRDLVNTRQPVRAADAFYRVQDEVLHAVIADAGIAHVNDLPPAPHDPRIALYQGDICCIDADAIVNAANSQLLGCWVPGHFCIDNAIHTFAGVQLREECHRIMQAQGHEEPTGQAKVTPAYNLPSRYVIHTVGPIAKGQVNDRLKAQLASSYQKCLDAAEEHGCNSIVFCCISTGVFGFPNEEAAEVAVDTVRAWLRDHPDSPLRVVFDLFGPRDQQIYRTLLSIP